MAGGLRRKIEEIEPARSVFHLIRLEGHLNHAFAENRLRTIPSDLLCGHRRVSRCVGLYGTLSYTVNIRRREVGLLLALGCGSKSRSSSSAGTRCSQHWAASRVGGSRWLSRECCLECFTAFHLRRLRLCPRAFSWRWLLPASLRSCPQCARRASRLYKVLREEEPTCGPAFARRRLETYRSFAAARGAASGPHEIRRRRHLRFREVFFGAKRVVRG
jgi:hypothetical protein